MIGETIVGDPENGFSAVEGEDGAYVYTKTGGGSLCSGRSTLPVLSRSRLRLRKDRLATPAETWKSAAWIPMEPEANSSSERPLTNVLSGN